jgi:hypothetical protein
LRLRRVIPMIVAVPAMGIMILAGTVFTRSSRPLTPRTARASQ